MVEEGQVKKDVATEELEAAAGVGRAVPQQPLAHPVGDLRGNALHCAVLAALTVAGDEERRRGRRRERDLPEPRDVGGIVLSVAVERGDPGRARRLDAAAHGSALAKAARMADEAQAREGAGEVADGGGGVVARPVIDIDDLVIEGAVERGTNLRHQRRDVRRLVAHGDDDGKLHAGWRVAQFSGSDKRQIGRGGECFRGRIS